MVVEISMSVIRKTGLRRQKKKDKLALRKEGKYASQDKPARQNKPAQASSK